MRRISPERTIWAIAGLLPDNVPNQPDRRNRLPFALQDANDRLVTLVWQILEPFIAFDAAE